MGKPLLDKAFEQEAVVIQQQIPPSDDWSLLQIISAIVIPLLSIGVTFLGIYWQRKRRKGNK